MVSGLVSILCEVIFSSIYLLINEVSCSYYSWLQWAQSHKHLKVVSPAVPVGILPSGYSGVLHDVKVFSRGPDDEIYDENEELRQKVRSLGKSFSIIMLCD